MNTIEQYEQRISDLRQYGSEDDSPVSVNESSYNGFKIFCDNLPHERNPKKNGLCLCDNGTLRFIMDIPDDNLELKSYTFAINFLDEKSVRYVTLKTRKCKTVSLKKLIATIEKDKELFEHLGVLK